MKTEKSRRVFVFGILIFVVFAVSIIGVSAGAVIREVQKGYERDAVFGLDGTLYLYQDGKISAVDSQSDQLGKYGPEVSPDKTKILYRHSVRETDFRLQVGVLALSGEMILEKTLDTDVSNEIMSMGWIDEETFFVTTHVNPATQEFFMYDLTGKELAHYYGYAFAPIPQSHKVMYAENVPLGFAGQAYHSYKIGDKVVFTAKDMGVALNVPSFDTIGSKVLFTGRENDQEILYMGDLQEDDNVKIERKIPLPDTVSGTPTFDEKGNICLINEKLLYTFDPTTEKFKEKIFFVDEKNSRFYKAFEKAFQKSVPGNILDVYGLTWLEDEAKGLSDSSRAMTYTEPNPE